MNRFACPHLFLSLSLLLLGAPALAAEPQRHRSPVDLAIVPGGRFVLTANQDADSVSLVDLERGQVVTEKPCGRRPVAVACSPDGKHAAVSNHWSGTVSLFEIDGALLKPTRTVPVGPLPRGLVFARTGDRLYLALAGSEEVVELDWLHQQIVQRWPAPREPRQLLLSGDGRWLLADSSRSAEVRCWDTTTRKLLWERRLDDAFNLRGLVLTPDGQGVVCVHTVRRSFPVSQGNIGQGWVIDSRLSELPLAAEATAVPRQIALDKRGQAVGDPYGVAFSPDGRWLAVTGSGTHELLLLETHAVPWSSSDPGDVLDPRLDLGDGKFRRVALGGRPLTVAFLGTSPKAVVANALLDAVQIVDGKTGQLVQTIALGGPARPSLVRKGEALFYDAERSHHQWFSCNTCHVEGHTCGLTFDTLNDDSYGNPKLTPSLRNVARTGPWTWHGWQKDLGAAVTKSLTQTMFGPEPTEEERKALVAFLETQVDPPNPHVGPNGQLSPAAQQGRALFQGKARCVRCHQGEYYTSEHTYDVKLDPDGSPYALWNPPSLRGVFDRGPYLHDGRAKDLDDLLQQHHAPEKLGAPPLTPAERQALIEFLQSL